MPFHTVLIRRFVCNLIRDPITTSTFTMHWSPGCTLSLWRVTFLIFRTLSSRRGVTTPWYGRFAAGMCVCVCACLVWLCASMLATSKAEEGDENERVCEEQREIVCVCVCVLLRVWFLVNVLPVC